MSLALFLRFSLRDFESGDFRTFTGPWYDFIQNNGGFGALKYDFANYTPLYLYLLALVATLFSSIPKVFAIKLISIPFDFICAFFVHRIVRLKYQSGSAPLFAFFAILLAPTAVLNSSLWGQVDIIYTTGLLACVYFLLTRREISAFVAFGLAFAFKLQAVFLAPLLIILLLKRLVSLRSFLIIPATYFVTILPAWLLGRSLPDLLTIYFKQADFYKLLTMSAPNLYQWIPDKFYDMLYPAGLLWAAAIIFIFLLIVYKSEAPMTRETMIEVAALSALLLPYALPKMHERYFFTADVLSIVFAFYFPRLFFIPILVGATSLFSYLPFLFGVTIIPLPLLAVALLVVIVIFFHHLVSTLYKKDGRRATLKKPPLSKSDTLPDTMTNITIAINAGGRSTRMGSDKALLEVGGRPMIEHIIEQTKGLGEQIIITNTPERYAHLGLPMFGDALPDKGALGGLYTAIQVAAQPYALVLACDMPFVNLPLLEHMISLAPDFDAVVPRITPPLPMRPSTSTSASSVSAQDASGEGPGVRAEAEPFRAIYSKACLEPIRRALDAGKMRVISFFPDLNLRWLGEDEIKQFDPELLTFLNCNTPEELEGIREIWEKREMGK